MVIYKLNKYLPLDGVRHVATTWRLYKDKEKTIILDEQYKEDSINIYYSDILIPTGETYYLVATRHLSENNMKQDTDLIHVTNNDKLISEMLLEKDVVVQNPILYVDRNDIFSDEGNTFNIRTSEYRGEGDGHMYTHWIVTDSDNEVIFTSLYDKVNKTSIDIPKNKDLRNKSYIHFKAIHVTGYNVESMVGEFTISVGNFNFDISTSLSDVPAYENLVVQVDRINDNKPTYIEIIEVLDIKTKEVIYKPKLSLDDTFTIPWWMLVYNKQFYIHIYAFDIKSNYCKLVKRLTVSDGKFKFIQHPNYKYNNLLTSYKKLNWLSLPDYISTDTYFENTVLMPIKGETVLRLIKIENDTLYDTGKYAKGVSMMGYNCHGSYIKSFNNRMMLLIDTISDNGVPIFMLYRYSIHNDRYTIAGSIERPDETMPMGYTNAIIQIDNTRFIYNPVGTNMLREYHMDTNKIVQLDDIPLQNANKCVIVRLHNNRILIMGGEDFKTVVYNYESKEYQYSVSISPESYINRNLKTVMLANGDTLIFKTEPICDANGDVIEESNCMMYFDYRTRDFLDTRISYTTYPNISITTHNPEIYLGKTEPTDPFKPEKEMTLLSRYN